MMDRWITCSRARARVADGGIGTFARIPLGSMCESPCDAVSGGAILSGPSAPETFAGDASGPRGGAPAADIRPRRMDVDRDGPQPTHRIPGPVAAALIHRRHIRTQVRSNEWTPSRSGEPPW